jgi:hypothetical protein
MLALLLHGSWLGRRRKQAARIAKKTEKQIISMKIDSKKPEFEIRTRLLSSP